MRGGVGMGDGWARRAGGGTSTTSTSKPQPPPHVWPPRVINPCISQLSSCPSSCPPLLSPSSTFSSPHESIVTARASEMMPLNCVGQVGRQAGAARHKDEHIETTDGQMAAGCTAFGRHPLSRQQAALRSNSKLVWRYRPWTAHLIREVESSAETRAEPSIPQHPSSQQPQWASAPQQAQLAWREQGSALTPACQVATGRRSAHREEAGQLECKCRTRGHPHAVQRQRVQPAWKRQCGQAGRQAWRWAGRVWHLKSGVGSHTGSVDSMRPTEGRGTHMSRMHARMSCPAAIHMS